MKIKKLSDFIAKSVVALDNGQEIGYVLDCVFSADLKTLTGFVVADEESERENFLSRNGIKLEGEDSFFIDDAYRLELNFAGATNNPIGKKVYDDKGCFLGTILDVVLDGFKCFKIITDKCEIPAKGIYSSGINCVFFSAKKRKNRKNTSKFDFKSDSFLPKVETQNLNNLSKFQILSDKTEIATPSKLVLAPATLLNKTATSDIYGLNNELIIKKGQIINQSKIDKAKKHGKINFLIINSK